MPGERGRAKLVGEARREKGPGKPRLHRGQCSAGRALLVTQSPHVGSTCSDRGIVCGPRPTSQPPGAQHHLPQPPSRGLLLT